MGFLRDLVNKGTEILKNADDEDAKLDAFLILQYITGMNRTSYYLHCDEEEFVSKGYEKEFLITEYYKLIERRASHVPLAYIFGYQDFCGLTFKVNENVLIPEQDTESLVEEVLKVVDGKSVFDLCTGSGCIAISIAKLGKPSSVSASDISTKALAIARENADRLGAAVTFYESDLFSSIEGKFDVIVSNPPYIKTDVIKGLAPEVRDHEPLLALDGDADGLSFYRKISKEAKEHLNKKGRIYYEIGYDEGAQVSEILADNGFQDIKVMQDLAGLDRIVAGRML